MGREYHRTVSGFSSTRQSKTIPADRSEEKALMGLFAGGFSVTSSPSSQAGLQSVPGSFHHSRGGEYRNPIDLPCSISRILRARAACRRFPSPML